MSVRYTAILFVGKKFSDEAEAQDFYDGHVDLSEEDRAYIDEENFSEFVYNKGQCEGELLNHYSEGRFVLGYSIKSGIYHPDKFQDVVQEAIFKWKSVFGDEPYEIICDVKVS